MTPKCTSSQCLQLRLNCDAAARHLSGSFRPPEPESLAPSSRLVLEIPLEKAAHRCLNPAYLGSIWISTSLKQALSQVLDRVGGRPSV